ncbi:HU family DNA-binding protein [Legionella sp. CNM-4043-24]|uniref:HU family DNA-binding protein n=1 Tax=Legionella sp. CNM-4043-24 TaxID=3421646 RepID=UPI00403AA506
MNKGELVDKAANLAGTTKVETARVLQAFTDVITEALKNGDQIVIPNFGTFSVVNRAARDGRNPQTGETLKIKASKAAKFKAGKSLKEAVQEA